ncbi:Hypothetical predicted protein [Pelobates cultripes]|uniref:Uncharacterized protein n=1 Tax=Pelobates cultripes TaxID=61616 RepID=A0AAD1RAU9_PELCU|nr:Hypothetical predicted protein [Pelobates cultripes]
MPTSLVRGPGHLRAPQTQSERSIDLSPRVFAEFAQQEEEEALCLHLRAESQLFECCHGNHSNAPFHVPSPGRGEGKEPLQHHWTTKEFAAPSLDAGRTLDGGDILNN